jgi:DNA topoisomerase-1
MGKSLVVVESPAKARTLQKYLGDDFEVMASVGHIRNLPSNRLGVDVDGRFEPEYVVIKEKAEVVRRLQKAGRSAEEIYLAADPDREGEAIAWHVAEEINQPEKTFRVRFNEITKRAVLDALSEPGRLSEDLYRSQQARRVVDRLVGYQISPLLWKKVKQGLSAGRVQSVAVRLVSEREREIEAFQQQEYWSIRGKASGPKPPPFPIRLFSFEGKKLDERKLDLHPLRDEQGAQRALDYVREQELRVAEVKRRTVRRKPSAPFITSTLQQEASRKLRFPARKTMRTAQRLYEGLDLGDLGTQGLITYMRTDSVRISDLAVAAVRGFIAAEYGDDYLPKSPNRYASRKRAQDAHEAIRPTSMEFTPDRVKPFLSKDELALYNLVWKRFLACQMAQGVDEQLTVSIEAGSDARLRASGTTVVFPGFRRVYMQGVDDESVDPDKESVIPPLQAGDALKLVSLDKEQHFTKPPPRYTEASLIRALEEEGIGRPSTYASIMSAVQDRGYVNKERGGRFRPSQLGMVVTDLLVEHFPELLDVKFTSSMEDQLDRIEDGDLVWNQLVADFNKGLVARLDAADQNMRNIKREGLATDETCPDCSAAMVLRWGRNGQFLACTRYPECKGSRSVVRGEDGRLQMAPEPTKTDETCEKCSSPMLLKHGRYGPYLACSAYPDCRTTRPVPGSEEEKRRAQPLPSNEGLPPCPKCEGQTVYRRGRFGPFVACGAYPKCKTILKKNKDGTWRLSGGAKKKGGTRRKAKRSGAA